MNYKFFLSAFFTGLFLSNFFPHFIHGISGNKFPTPFAKPRGVGLSSSLSNVIWGLFNLLLSYGCFIATDTETINQGWLIFFFAGFSAMSVFLSIRFKSKHKE